MSASRDLQPLDEPRIEQVLRAFQEAAVSVRTQVAIAGLTTSRVGGPASLYIEPGSVEVLARSATVIAALDLPALVIGRGSNILVSDEGFPGIVIHLGRGFGNIGGDGEGVIAGGAASIPQVANWASRRSLSGLEFSIAIPASVGGAVRMNAGAHGASIDDVLVSAAVLSLGDGQVRLRSATDLGFAYRHTDLSDDEIVVEVTFGLRTGDKAQIARAMESYRAHRAETQPTEAPNAGSMFMNPPDDSAGRLIEAAGLKGHSCGRATVSPKHANFFLAALGATASDVYELMSGVQEKVLNHSGTLLIPEVRIVGRFETPTPLRVSV